VGPEVERRLLTRELVPIRRGVRKIKDLGGGEVGGNRSQHSQRADHGT